MILHQGYALEPISLSLASVWGIQVFAGFIDGALGVVAGLDGLAILIDGARTLAGYVEYLAQSDMTPDLCPAWLLVAIEGLAVFVGRRLVVALQVKDLSDAIVRQGTVLVDFQGLVELGQRLH